MASRPRTDRLEARARRSPRRAAFALLTAWLACSGLALLHAAEPTAREDPQIFRDERDVVPPLNADTLAQVRDSRSLPILEDLRTIPERDLGEWQAYLDAVEKAYRYPSTTFAHSARSDVTYAHVFTEPRKYRGQVLHFEGELWRVRRYDPPTMLTQAGVRDLYEGWIFSKIYGANPFCVIFTELPEGLSVGEQMKVPVAFDGYFFKKYRYQAADSKPGQAREVPLLIGHGPVLLGAPPAPPAETTSAWSGSFLAVLMVLVVGTLAAGIGLHWWFRRGDNQVRARVAGSRAFVDPSAVTEPPAEPYANGDGPPWTH